MYVCKLILQLIFNLSDEKTNTLYLTIFCYDFAFSQCSIVIPSLHTTSNSTGGSQQGQSFNTGSATGLLTTIRTNAIGGVSGTQTHKWDSQFDT